MKRVGILVAVGRPPQLVWDRLAACGKPMRLDSPKHVDAVRVSVRGESFCDGKGDVFRMPHRMTYFVSEPRPRSRHEADLLDRLGQAIVWLHREPLLPAQSSLQRFAAAAVAMVAGADTSTLVVVELDQRGRVQSLDAIAEHGVQRQRPELQGRTLWPSREHAMPASALGSWALSARSGGTWFHESVPLLRRQTCALFVHSTNDATEDRAMSASTQSLLHAYMRVVACLVMRAFPDGVSSDHTLFPREEAVAARLVRGEAVSDVAQQLGISVNTVGCHLKRMHKKYRVSSRSALVARLLGASSSGYPLPTQPKPSTESKVDDGGCP